MISLWLQRCNLLNKFKRYQTNQVWVLIHQAGLVFQCPFNTSGNWIPAWVPSPPITKYCLIFLKMPRSPRRAHPSKVLLYVIVDKPTKDLNNFFGAEKHRDPWNIVPNASPGSEFSITLQKCEAKWSADVSRASSLVASWQCPCVEDFLWAIAAARDKRRFRRRQGESERASHKTQS